MERQVRVKVLVCPLDWGLGHATRCVPVINALLRRGLEVVVAADGPPLEFLRQEFGDRVDYRQFPGKNIRYPARGPMALKIFSQLPSLFLSVVKEHFQLKKLIRDTGAGMVISDNRYGLWNKKIFSVFITHQVFIRAPHPLKWTEPILWRLVHFFIRRYDQCWVPDYATEPNLSGALSHAKPFEDLVFTGPLSRFSELLPAAYEDPLPDDFPPDFFLVVLSGPEPQRTFLEEDLISQFKKTGKAVVLVQGKPGKFQQERLGNLLTINHLPTPQLAWLIQRSRLVICRPGYSGLMDLAVFGKKALLIPTPGQTEQEYLGNLLQRLGQAHCASQGQVDLQGDLAAAESHTGILKTVASERIIQGLAEALLKMNQ